MSSVPPPTIHSPQMPVPKKNWFLRHKIMTALLAFFFLMVVVSPFTGGDDSTPAADQKLAPSVTSSVTTSADPVTTSTEPAPSASSTPVTPTAAAVTTPVAPVVKKPSPRPTKALTMGQKNALRSAEDYLGTMPFSRRGLIKQLSSSAGDGYSVKDATFAAEHVKVNWNEQAAKAAKAYLDLMPFSRQGLIQQLESSAGDGYTHRQAVFGAKKAGL